MLFSLWLIDDFLSGISQSDLPFVFKGGTSLSKAYGLIDRFSEDIDLSMNRKPTEGEKKADKEFDSKLSRGFRHKEIISSRFYESDYNNITKKLLYEDVSYNDAIEKGIALVADMDIFEYKK